MSSSIYVDNKWVLMYSQIGVDKYPTKFLIGEFDGTKFIPKKANKVIAGPHYYAPQTFEDHLGRRIIVGWFYSWDRKLDEGATSAGAFSIPCQIRIINNKIKIYSVEEVTHLLHNKVSSSINGIKLNVSKSYVQVKSKDKDMKVYCSPLEVEIIEDTKALEVFINKGEKILSIWR